MNLQDADPSTLRMIADDLNRQALQLKRQADRIERDIKNSFSRPFRPARAARLANAMITAGMNRRTAILMASAKAKVPESTTRAALDKLEADRRKKQKARTVSQARAIIAGGSSLRETAAALDIPKSTLADWLR